MAERVRFAPDRAFPRMMLKSPAARALCLARGEGIRARAASMYDASAYGLRAKEGARRVRAIVYTADMHAARSNLRHNTLRKAMGGR